MAYDVQPSKGYDPGENPFYITLQGNDAAEITAQWHGLANGAATILIPLAPAPFARSTACSPTASASPGSSASKPLSADRADTAVIIADGTAHHRGGTASAHAAAGLS